MNHERVGMREEERRGDCMVSDERRGEKGEEEGGGVGQVAEFSTLVQTRWKCGH